LPEAALETPWSGPRRGARSRAAAGPAREARRER
jgi:hypothetical protein